ncbi:MAG: AMP-binding protein, partial [Myxococcota bacterium]|nr:AMP-binding protein [Myxococcota bacterium]
MESAAHNIARWLSRHAALHGARPALVDEERRLDYAALETRCRRAAGLLRGLGVGRGDRVAMLLGNRAAAVELVFATARLGAIVVPLNTRLAPPEVAALLDDCRPRLLVHEDELGELARKAVAATAQPPGATLAVGGTPCAWEAGLGDAHEVQAVLPVEPDHPMILMYTSGTTGTPKGALLPHRKTLFNALNAQIFFELTWHDRVGVVVPLFHSFGLKILSLPALYAGACVVLRRRFDAPALWEDVARERLSVLGGVPTMFRALDEAWEAAPTPPDAGSLRFLFTAGAAVPVELIHAFEARGLRLKQGFGQTETSILCCLDVE